ncbi:MAG: hypothetical protein CME62_10890 [Halobacteriovoraceae bacterium]|nr:hypothetical protein [Halobacteriovoraceae bacterium]|tara:strand:+ start:4754 stop:5788 length:1035 start_codon:yes stop_codon:yes gene_type:complete
MKFVLFLCLFSCAKISYIYEQGTGQIALEYKGRANEKVLADKDVSQEHKEKIKLIQKAKAYFHQYFDIKATNIYEQTTFLDQDAVSYLVIHSPDNKIQALPSCFPIAGCFPYLGFFRKSSAMNFKAEKEEEGFHTYMRPVYAYSTLNHPMIPFDDNILSSFFHFNDEQLVALIFHELIHTIFFVKNQTQFNENLAEFVAQKLQREYLNLNEDYYQKRSQRKLQGRLMNNEIVKLSEILAQKYKTAQNKPSFIFENFMRNTFEPSIRLYCKQNNIETPKCWPLKVKWNNARFAALRTYEAKQNQIEELYKKMNLNLKDFMHKLIKLENEYTGEMSFLEFVKKKEL